MAIDTIKLFYEPMMCYQERTSPCLILYTLGTQNGISWEDEIDNVAVDYRPDFN